MVARVSISRRLESETTTTDLPSGAAAAPEVPVGVAAGWAGLQAASRQAPASDSQLGVAAGAATRQSVKVPANMINPP